MEWGAEAEARAMIWLLEQGYHPVNDSHLNKGWDISCLEKKFEVKGRKSHRTAVRMSQNEWIAAKRFKEQHTVLIFTATNKSDLQRATPRQISNLANNPESWKQRVVYEYVLVD